MQLPAARKRLQSVVANTSLHEPALAAGRGLGLGVGEALPPAAAPRVAATVSRVRGRVVDTRRWGALGVTGQGGRGGERGGGGGCEAGAPPHTPHVASQLCFLAHVAQNSV